MMSPATALHDPIFRAYFCLLLGVLAIAALVLAFLKFVFGKELGNIWSTYRSWLVMGPLVALAIFAGRGPFIAGIAAAAAFAFHEFARVSALDRDRWMKSAVYLGIAGVGAASLGGAGDSCAVPSIFVALILLLPILRNRAVGETLRVSLGLIAFLYLGWMFGQLGALANSTNSYGYLCYLIFATEVSDVAAFTFGKIFGRHLLRSEISPRKTWEGALGALTISLILPWLLRFSFPFFGPRQLLLAGLIVGLGGQIGDLAISVLKRDFGAKDMGAFIPGHGGVLDRIDSLIFTAPLFTLMTQHYYPGR